MSQRVVATAFGGPEVLQLVDYEPDAVTAGHVRIAVRAAAVNPWDHKQYSGAMGHDESQLPLPIGVESAGEVVEAGADAVGPTGPISVGDAVIADFAPGAYATELTVPASAVYAKPATLDWSGASGLLTTGSTAAHLMAVSGLGEGDTVLIHGASSSVGRSAIQLARLRGARVIGTASERNHDALRELGAEPTTYGAGLADRVRELAPDGLAAAFDMVGTDEAIDVSVELLGGPERVTSIAAFHRVTDGIRLIGSGPGAEAGTDIRTAAKRELIDLAAAGSYRVFVGATYPLADAAEAHRTSIAGHPGGKLVLLP